MNIGALKLGRELFVEVYVKNIVPPSGDLI